MNEGAAQTTSRAKASLDLAWLIGKIASFVTVGVLCLLVRKAWSDMDTAWDSLAYHLPFAAMRGGILSQQDYHFSQWIQDLYRGIPVLSSYLQGFAWRLTSHVQAANFIGLLGLLGLSIALWRIKGIGIFHSLLCWFAIPLVLIESASAYDDLWVNSITTIFLLLLFDGLLFPHNLSLNRVLICLFLLAVAMNSKLQFMPVGTLGLLALSLALWMSRSEFRIHWSAQSTAMRSAFVVCATLLCFAGYGNSLKNWAEFHNPIYPVALDLGPLRWGGNYHALGVEPGYLAHTPQPIRWLLSVCEFDSFDGRRPLWTNGEGDITNPSSHALRMGGFYATYVAVNVLFFASLQQQLSRRLGRKPLVFFVAMTVITACLPASHELRYYSYWMLTLVGINLWLISELPGNQERLYAETVLLGGALASLFFVLSSTGGQYLAAQQASPANLVRGLRITQELQKMQIKPGEAICVFEKQPLSFLYAPIFNPALASQTHYRVMEAYRAEDCSGTRIVPPR